MSERKRKGRTRPGPSTMLRTGFSRRDFIKATFALGTVSYFRLADVLPNLFHGQRGETPVSQTAKPPVSNPMVSVLKTDSDVYRASNQKVYELVRRVVATTEGFKFQEGATVLLKPNMAFPAAWETGSITDPRLVQAVVRLVREQGAGRVVVADSSVVGSDTEEVYTMSGMRAVVEEAGAELVDLRNSDFVPVRLPVGGLIQTIHVGRPVFEADYVIGLPVLKEHASALVTLSLKNMKGTMLDADKRRFHALGLHQGIAELNAVFRPDYVILDGLIGMVGPGCPGFGTTKAFGLVMAANDGLALDTVAATFLGVDPRRVGHLNLADQYGVGTMDLRSVELRLENVEAPSLLGALT